jgi:hypothetical protein
MFELRERDTGRTRDGAKELAVKIFDVGNEHMAVSSREDSQTPAAMDQAEPELTKALDTRRAR